MVLNDLNGLLVWCRKPRLDLSITRQRGTPEEVLCLGKYLLLSRTGVELATCCFFVAFLKRRLNDWTIGIGVEERTFITLFIVGSLSSGDCMVLAPEGEAITKRTMARLYRCIEYKMFVLVHSFSSPLYVRTI